MTEKNTCLVSIVVVPVVLNKVLTRIVKQIDIKKKSKTSQSRRSMLKLNWPVANAHLFLLNKRNKIA